MSRFFSWLFGRGVRTASSAPEVPADGLSEATLTFIVTYYNQGAMLSRLIEGWEAWPDEVKAKVKFLIVDDGSKVAAIDHAQPKTIDLAIYRVMEDKYCNIGGARNLGTKMAETEWILHTDMDHVTPPKAAAAMLELVELDQRRIYKFIRSDRRTGKTKIHPGTMLLTRSMYWKVGGCDEDFVGNYGQTDIHFFYRADQIVETEFREDIMLEFEEEGEAPVIDRSKLEPNALLLEEKKAKASWSDDFLRFEWEKVL
jgi:hypothetical protein